MPPEFVDSRDQSYRRGAQDIAGRAGCSIEIRDNDAFLISEFSEERICTFTNPDQPWYEIWTAAMARYPELYHTHRYYNP